MYKENNNESATMYDVIITLENISDEKVQHDEEVLTWYFLFCSTKNEKPFKSFNQRNLQVQIRIYSELLESCQNVKLEHCQLFVLLDCFGGWLNLLFSLLSKLL